MTTTPTPSLKIKLRLGGFGSSQPSASSSSSFSGTVPPTPSVGTPATVTLQASVRPSSTSVPGAPVNNQHEGSGQVDDVSTAAGKKRRNRRKNATAEGAGRAKTSVGDEVKALASHGTPSDSRQGTPTFDSQPTRGNRAMGLIKDRNVRPRKWRRDFMLIRTVGGGMEVPMWRTDDQPRIASLPNSTGSASSNADAANANDTPPVPAPIVKPPFDPTRPFACPEANCIKAFPSEDKLASHTVAVHGPKIHGCDMCWKRFGKKEQLARHRKTHLIHARASSYSSAHEKAPRASQTGTEDGERDVKDDSETDEEES